MELRKKTRLLLILGIGLMMLFTYACNGGGDGGSDDDPADRFVMEWAMAQYRNYENAASNRYMVVFGITDDGGPAQESDVIDGDMTDSSGNSIGSTDDGFWKMNYYAYDCRGGGCTQSGPLEETGLWGRFDTLDADTYSLEVEMSNGQILTGDVDYPGMLAVPFVTSASMDSQWNSGDLDLTWTNPTGEANWAEVDQLRVYLMDSDYATLLVLRLDHTDESATIPASLIANAKAMGNGGMTRWYIQTRAYDANNMNYARAYSNNKDLASVYAVDYSDINYRTFEPPRTATTRGYVGLSNNGGPIDVPDLVSYDLYDSGASLVDMTTFGIYSYSDYAYDCRSGSCTQSGPNFNSGLWFGTDPLVADTYTMEMEMDNGQTFSVDMDYPGETALPPVTSASMTATWDGGDLDLNWTNPTGGTNWSEVDELRITIRDATDADVISVKVNPADSSVTIPAALVADAEALNASTLAEWLIQTRAYDSGQNFARGYSGVVAIP